MSLAELWPVVRRSRFALSLVLAASIGLLVVSEVGYDRATTGLNAIDQASDARYELRQLYVLMLDAESGQRSYLLSGNRDFLQPYSRARAAIEAQLAHLNAIYRGWPEEAAKMKAIEGLTRDKLSELQTTLNLYEQGRRVAAVEMVQSGIGRDRMREFEDALTAMSAEAARRSQLTVQAQRDTLRHSRAALAALVVLSVLVLALYLRQTDRLNAERERRQVDLRAERDRLDAEVQRRTSDLVEVARHLQSAREDERSRLARELHDELGGLLTAAKLEVARIKSRLRDAPPDTAERIVHLVAALDAGIALKRRIIEDLRPSTLAHLGLKAALETLCRDFARRSDLAVKTELDDVVPGEELQLTLYRLVQESLTNVAKYARASQVEVRLKADPTHVALTVVDDGVGFDPERIPQRSRGLDGMRFRVESSGGTLDIWSRPGEGTRVDARLPLDF